MPSINHVNFIEIRPSVLKMEKEKFELDYFKMILCSVCILVVCFSVNLLQSREINARNRELALIRQGLERPKPVEKPVAPIAGLEWSKILEKYLSQFPKYLKLKSIHADMKDGRKIAIQASGNNFLDASYARKNMAHSGLCAEVELKSLDQSEENVNFELECTLL